MKATVDPALMKVALKQISPVISKNVVLSQLLCVKMDFDHELLKMTGSDLKTEVSIDTTCTNKAPFSILMPVSEFSDICDKAPGPVTIEFKKDHILVSHDKPAKFKIPIHGETKDFPTMSIEDAFIHATVDGDFFYSLSGAAKCGSKNPQMTHQHNAAIDFKKDGMSIVGTDAVVLYKKDFSELKFKTPTVAQVSAHFIALTESFQDTEISLGDKTIVAKYNNITVSSRLPENKYLDYRAILPKKVDFNLSIDRKELISSIQMIGIAFDKKNKDVLFTFKPGGELLLEASDYMGGLSGDTILSLEHEINIPTVRLSGDRLLSLLNTINDKTIKMSFSSEKNPVYIQPEDDDTRLLFIGPLQMQHLK